MGIDFIQLASQEQQQLEAAIVRLDTQYRADRKSLQQRLEAIKQVRNAYAHGVVGETPNLFDLAADKRPGLVRLHLAKATADTWPSKDKSFKAQVVQMVSDILSMGMPWKSKDLLEYLENNGLQFKAKNKINNLSVILSSDPRFVSDRKIGWTLKGETPQDASTSTGFQ